MKKDVYSPEGLAKYNAIVEERRARWARYRRIYRLVLLFIIAASIAGAFVFESLAVVVLIAGFLLLMSFAAGAQEQRLKVDEYLGLPGAVDGQGEHRCIACGHGGIYRRTIYKTSTTVAACSRCEQPLWATEGES